MKGAEEKAPLCDALYQLAEHGEQTGEVQESWLFKEQPMTIACSVDETNPALGEYCHVVLQKVIREFTHAYPWQVRACIRADGGQVKIKTADEYSGLVGRKKIVRLDGRMRSGTTVRLRFEPAKGQDGSAFGPYWGHYVLTLMPAISAVPSGSRHRGGLSGR
tara:strand:- start:21 stop:506 length:486 start_codon:yes stop_codon:yes gene_type:complete